MRQASKDLKRGSEGRRVGVARMSRTKTKVKRVWMTMVGEDRSCIRPTAVQVGGRIEGG